MTTGDRSDPGSGRREWATAIALVIVHGALLLLGIALLRDLHAAGAQCAAIARDLTFSERVTAFIDPESVEAAPGAITTAALHDLARQSGNDGWLVTDGEVSTAWQLDVIGTEAARAVVVTSERMRDLQRDDAILTQHLRPAWLHCAGTALAWITLVVTLIEIVLAARRPRVWLVPAFLALTATSAVLLVVASHASFLVRCRWENLDAVAATRADPLPTIGAAADVIIGLALAWPVAIGLAIVVARQSGGARKTLTS